MKILVTGDTGYIGTALCQILLNKGYDVVGLDLDIFLENDLKKINRKYKRIYKDIRLVNEDDLKNIECVIHLAGISNDPLGELNEDLTYSINLSGTINLAKKAKKVGVKKFLYASTQSVYGISKKINEEIKEDSNNILPITAYAKSKYKAEIELLKIVSKDFHVIIFRPATVFGPSFNFRSDIVLNNLAASAFLYNKIIIQSDGTPWRPVLNIDDMCMFLISAINKSEMLNKEIINLGYPGHNYQILELASKIKENISNSKIVIENKKIDNRTYKVNFDKAYKFFKNDIDFDLKIDFHIKKLIEFFKETNFDKKIFEGRKTVRMKQMKYLIKNKKIFQEKI